MVFKLSSEKYEIGDYLRVDTYDGERYEGVLADVQTVTMNGDMDIEVVGLLLDDRLKKLCVEEIAAVKRI